MSLFSVVLSVALVSAAHAEQRVIVVMKDAASFQTVNRALQARDASLWKDVQMNGVPMKHVEASLENLSTFIVNTQSDAEIVSLRENPAVKIVEAEVIHPLPQPVGGMALNSRGVVKDVPGPQTPWGILAVRAPQAWAKSNQGQGARVLVLDTGIDKDHPAIKANFEQGRDFTGRSNGDDFSDLVGHGTHVSGTVAAVQADNGFVGVAPKAKLLMGRVCSTLGCSSAAIVSGINWGISQKVDVISMSLGGPWATPAEADAVKKADQSGTSIVAASGNDGTSKVSFPAALPTAVAVGAVDNTLKKADFSQYGPELAVVAPGVGVLSSVPRGTGRESEVYLDEGQGNIKVNSSTFQGGRDVFTAETNLLVPAGLGKPEDFKGKDFKGKYALVSRGEILFSDKAKNAGAAGATGVVIYNNAPGLIEGALSTDGTTLPVAAFMIEQEVGQRLLAEINAGKAVKATLHTIATDYMEFPGTSMATPHVSGVVALIKAANPKLTPAQVKAILKQTAQQLGPNDQNQYGAGIVNAEAAVNAAVQTH